MKNKAQEGDSGLVEACINGDARAWALLVDKYSHLILASIANRLKSYGFDPACEEIEDVRQAVLSSIWKDKKLAGVRNRDDISYWIAIVSGNAAMQYLRRTRFGEAARAVSLSGKVREESLVDVIPSAGPIPSGELQSKEVLSKIERAIKSLPPKERLIVKLNIMYGKKYSEISDILNMPHGTVASHLRRAKKRLKKDLKDL